MPIEGHTNRSRYSAVYLLSFCSKVLMKTVGANSFRPGIRSFGPYRRLRARGLQLGESDGDRRQKVNVFDGASYNKSVDFRTTLARLNQKASTS
jgi:hypothetical protein